MVGTFCVFLFYFARKRCLRSFARDAEWCRGGSAMWRCCWKCVYNSVWQILIKNGILKTVLAPGTEKNINLLSYEWWFRRFFFHIVMLCCWPTWRRTVNRASCFFLSEEGPTYIGLAGYHIIRWEFESYGFVNSIDLAITIPQRWGANKQTALNNRGQ